jgi:hypothetical protein
MCLSHLIYTVRPCLIHTCHAMPCPCHAPTMPFFSRPRHSTVVESISLHQCFLLIRLSIDDTTCIGLTRKQSVPTLEYTRLFRHARKIAKSHYYLRYVRLSFRMEQLDSLDGLSWKLTPEYFSKICQDKILISLKSDKNNVYFTWRHTHIYDNTSLNS